jgi:LysM repeat protein
MRHIPNLQSLLVHFVWRWSIQAQRKVWGTLILVGLLIMLTACGQVVNLETPTPAPTAAVTADDPLSTVLPRPTVTMAMPTATQPNTPTPSPTPIIHVVQSGETLIAIALQYGVTVDALQSANGIQDPSTLQVNQELFIPMGAESRSEDSSLLLATPTAVAFAIEGENCREQPIGSVWCLGEVINNTGSSIENAQVRITLFDAFGAELASDDVFAALDLIPSGQRAPFGVLFPSLPTSHDQFWAAPIRAEASNEPANRYAPLELTTASAGPAGSLFEISGTVVNPSQRAIASVTVVVTTYNAEGLVTGFRQARLPEALPARTSTDFSVSLMPYDGVPDTYAVAVQGRLANP